MSTKQNTTSYKDNNKVNQQKQSKPKKNKKMFVYTPDENSEDLKKINDQKAQKINQASESSKNNNKCNNKKKFVYTPDEDEKAKEHSQKENEHSHAQKENSQKAPKVTEFAPVVIPTMKKITKTEQKESEADKEKHNNNSKNNKKRFVYNPSEDEQKEMKQKEEFKFSSKSEDEKERKKDDISNVKIDLTTPEPLDLVSVIRDALFNAFDNNVDIVRFIPGQNLSIPENRPILRILVLLTSKRLGFESNVNSDNDGVVSCKFSSHSRSSAVVPYMPNKNEQEDLNRNDTLLKAFGMKTGDNLNIDNLSFRAVKSRFPHMPTICIGIICVKRTPKEALEFAQSFENSLSADNELEISNDDSQSDMKILKLLAQKYGFEKDLLEQIVAEKQKQKSQIFLDQMSKNNSNELFKHLTDSLEY